MHELKAGLDTKKFDAFRRFLEGFYHSFVLQMTFTAELSRARSARSGAPWVTKLG